jgi:hypothetical protein
VQPVEPFLKLDMFGSFSRFGDRAGGGCQISPLFHEDDQDDQDDQVLIDHLAWVVAMARMRAHSTETVLAGC